MYVHNYCFFCSLNDYNITKKGSFSLFNKAFKVLLAETSYTLISCKEKAKTMLLERFSIIIERTHSQVQQPCQLIGTKESFYIKKEFNSYRISLVQQHGHRFIVLKHRYGCHDVTCIHCLNQTLFLFFKPDYSITQQKAKTRHLKQRTGHFTQDIDTGDLSKNILILVFSNQNMGTR